jgi:hypothetical protein
VENSAITIVASKTNPKEASMSLGRRNRVAAKSRGVGECVREQFLVNSEVMAQWQAITMGAGPMPAVDQQSVNAAIPFS